MLAEAKLDAGLMSRLGDGIKNFENAAQGLTSASETVLLQINIMSKCL